MYVYSGQCKFCEVGLPTTIKDDSGVYLSTGDIVMAYSTTEDFGVTHFATLSVVVANNYTNISGQEPTRNKEDDLPFVMGIKDCETDKPLKKYPSTVWRVKKIKGYEDVISGEKWKDYGFSFRDV